MLTLTETSADPLDAQGHARDFWHRWRQRHLGAIYYCWLELQARGAVHYHAMVVNPPGRRKADLVHQVQRWWPHGRSQVRFRAVNRRDEKFEEYALKYADKMGKKRYQQYYEDVPRQLRTFMNQRLEIPPAELKHHLDRTEFAYVPQSVYRGELIEEHLLLVAEIVHNTDPDNGCCARLHRQSVRSRGPRAPDRR